MFMVSIQICLWFHPKNQFNSCSNKNDFPQINIIRVLVSARIKKRERERAYNNGIKMGWHLQSVYQSVYRKGSTKLVFASPKRVEEDVEELMVFNGFPKLR